MEKPGESKTHKSFEQAQGWKIVYGNSLNALADALAQELFGAPSHPFEKRLVVVPDASLKDFLFRTFAEDPRLQIAAGVQILPLNQAIMEILDGSGAQVNKKRIPTFLELSLAIEEALHALIAGKEPFPSLQDYTGTQDEEKKNKRIALLSDELSRLFTRYGLYGNKFLPDWRHGWQRAVWDKIFSEDSPWTFPLESLKKTRPGCFDGKIALFGFSFLAPAHLSFFCSVPATVYHLSPTAFFWEDLVSDKERLFTQRKLQRNGVKENVREELDSYMKEGHPLLGNWGRLGREMLKSLGDFLLEEEDVYCPIAEETLLGQIRRSLLTLEEEGSLKQDSSLQLHSATSKLREVEVLHDLLLAHLHKQNTQGDPIRPRDILIASPDIAAYAPYIQMVFSEGPLPFAIRGMPLSALSETASAFLQLLSLPKEEYALSAVLALLHARAFRDKQGFAFDEVHRMEKWFKEAHIIRALSGGLNSWEAGLNRLILGLAVKAEDLESPDLWPIECVPSSEIDLLSQFLSLFRAIQADLAALQEKKSASEWFEWLAHLAEMYFDAEWEKEPIFQELKSLARGCRTLKEKIWNFESIERVLSHLFQKGTGEIGSSQWDRITFAPLQFGHAASARIIACLGMDEAAFPRSEARSSLCEMSRLKKGDYVPSRPEEDRALFLDLILKAQDALIFTYQRIHPEDGKHQGPSPLIDELNHYLQLRGVEGGIAVSHHGPLPPCGAVTKHSQKTRFLPEPTAATASGEIYVDIKHLKKLARDPLAFYFNRTLKIYLREEEDEEEKEFYISNLRRSMLRKNALASSLQQVMQESLAAGKLPHGLFQDAAVQELQEEMEDLTDAMKEFGLRADEVSTIHLSAACIPSEKNATFLPPLTLSLEDGTTVHIVGELENVTPQGLLFHGKEDFSTLLKAWPLYLVYCCLFPENRALLLTKDGEKVEIPLADPRSTLSAYLRYYLLAEKAPSPLMPEWGKAFFKGEEEFAKVQSKGTAFDNVHFDYLMRREEPFDSAFAFWQDKLQKLFEPLLAREEA